MKAVGIDGAVTGGLICFDIRFPEMARSLALQGAQILLVAAQFPHPRAMHWETLLKARAIEIKCGWWRRTASGKAASWSTLAGR